MNINIAPCWQTLVTLASCKTNNYTCNYTFIAGNGIMSGIAFRNMRVEDFSALRHEYKCAFTEEDEAFFTSPRYIGVQFAVAALTLGYRREIDEYIDIVRRQFNSVYLFGHEDAIICMAIDGWETAGCEAIRKIALHWLRIQASARRIQLWWRHKLVARRMAMVRMTLVPFIVRFK